MTRTCGLPFFFLTATSSFIQALVLVVTPSGRPSSCHQHSYNAGYPEQCYNDRMYLHGSQRHQLDGIGAIVSTSSPVATCMGAYHTTGITSTATRRRSRLSSTTTSLFSFTEQQQEEGASDQNSGQKQQQQPNTKDKEQSRQHHQELTADQLNFVLGYLNQHHSDLLQKFAEAYSSIGTEMARANAWSGGSYQIQKARIVHIDCEIVQLAVQVQKRGGGGNKSGGGKGDEEQMVQFPLSATPIPERRRYYQETKDVPNDYMIHKDDHNNQNSTGNVLIRPRLPIDDIVRRLCRLCWIVNMPEVTGKLIQLAIQLNGTGIGKLPDQMYLNQVPHNRYVREFFYDGAAQAALEAIVLCSKGYGSNRMQLIGQFPEMNPSMDSYRIGTLLEMVRTITIRLAEENLRVKVCVQGSMGVGIFTGVPKQLSGVYRLVQLMDWQSNVGEINEGMIGNYVRFGGVGPQHVMDEIVRTNTDGTKEIMQYQDDVFILIAPQSMVGTDSSIIPSLMAMVQAAGDRPIILINPDLSDKVSAAGQQSVRGRKERIEFAQSFESIYHFQNIYLSGTSYFPILGAMTKLHPMDPWVAHQRRDYVDGSGEVYVPMLASESKPEGEVILRVFDS